ncbi:hypothetical protein DPMN_088196 [Dreissena polymorpha]|uniref:Uncharacterized protein n=1 Tax=Dreissena polymorpha TaxID=45954 RepID=A0A9D4KUD8_DREPO|nr:hypothetical protein DPMN_088196 [Dreissena polymorpha]
MPRDDIEVRVTSRVNSSIDQFTRDVTRTCVQFFFTLSSDAVTQILTVLETIRDENRETKRMLQRLLARSATDDEPMQLPENISLPIGTFEQMDEFEEHLGDEATIHLF